MLIQDVQVSSTVHLSRGAEFYGLVGFISGRVGQNFELAGGSFHHDVDLTGTQIDGELRLGRSDHGPARWSPNSMLTLRNTSVGAIQDLPNSWPNKLDLNGFTYHNLGGLSGPDSPMINRTAKWFEDWLGKQAPYSPAPYQQLASVLRAQGKPDTADDILYAGRERERDDACARWSHPGLCVRLATMEQYILSIYELIIDNKVVFSFLAACIGFISAVIGAIRYLPEIRAVLSSAGKRDAEKIKDKGLSCPL
jgi:hypothetical protein